MYPRIHTARVGTGRVLITHLLHTQTHTRQAALLALQEEMDAADARLPGLEAAKREAAQAKNYKEAGARMREIKVCVLLVIVLGCIRVLGCIPHTYTPHNPLHGTKVSHNHPYTHIIGPNGAAGGVPRPRFRRAAAAWGGAGAGADEGGGS